MPTAKALILARNLGLDLVEVSDKSDPPICKIIDYGKFKYDESKKKSAQQTHKQKLKEIQLRVRIEEHDYRVKMARAEGFLDQGDKLNLKLRFRGRENAHRDLGFDLMDRVVEDLNTMAKVDSGPKLIGRSIVMMVSPLPKSKQKRKFVDVVDDGREDDDEPDDDENDLVDEVQQD